MQVLSAVIERGLSRGYCDPNATACCAFQFAKFPKFFLLAIFISSRGILQRFSFKNLQSIAKQKQRGLMASTAITLLTNIKSNFKIK
jgi:hypothetical protein